MAIPTIQQVWPAEISAQEVFDHVLAHLRAQEGERAADEKGFCSYRTLEGRACAAGALLSDEEAAKIRPVYQGKSWDTLQRDGYVPARLHPHVDLIRGLQVLHDRDAEARIVTQGGYAPYDAPGDQPITRARVQRLAQDHGLTYEPPPGADW